MLQNKNNREIFLFLKLRFKICKLHAKEWFCYSCISVAISKNLDITTDMQIILFDHQNNYIRSH